MAYLILNESKGLKNRKAARCIMQKYGNIISKEGVYVNSFAILNSLQEEILSANSMKYKIKVKIINTKDVINYVFTEEV